RSQRRHRRETARCGHGTRSCGMNVVPTTAPKIAKVDEPQKGAAQPAKSSVSRASPRDFSMLIALLLIWAFFALRQPVFLSARNLSLLLIELSVTAVLALGMLVVLLPNQIDLSAGSGVGLTGAIAAVLVFNARWPA